MPSTNENELRQFIINEMVDTEERYLEDMAFVIMHYMRPMKEDHVISEYEFKKIFGDLLQVFEFSECFYRRLYHAVSKPPHKQRIGRLFLDFAEGFKSYTMYCSNHPNAIAAMYRLDKRRSWKAFLGNVEQRTNRGRNLELEALLMTPVQRICRYPLLLKQLRKATPATHPDYPDLAQAIDAIQSVADYINKMKRKIENLQVLVELQQKIDGWEVPSLLWHGELLYCGDLHIGPYTAGPKGTRPYFVLALTRTVVVLRSQLLTGRYLVKKIWPYKEIRLRTTGANEKNAFSLAHSPPGGETELYLLQASSSKEKDKWLSLLRENVPGAAPAPAPQAAVQQAAKPLMNKLRRTERVSDVDVSECVELKPQISTLLLVIRSTIDVLKSSSKPPRSPRGMAGAANTQPHTDASANGHDEDTPTANGSAPVSLVDAVRAELDALCIGHAAPCANDATEPLSAVAAGKAACTETEESNEMAGEAANEVAAADTDMALALDALVESMLADNVCMGCRGPVCGVDEALAALDGTWHPACFKCGDCNTPLDGSYYVMGGRPLCARDFDSKLQCSVCRGPIRAQQKYTCIDDVNIHQYCATCTVCGKPGSSGPMCYRDGQLFCAEDYLSKNGPRCALCDAPATGELMRALNKTWHKACFVCTYQGCGERFEGGKFYSILGQPRCQYHYCKEKGLLCTRCDGAITAEYVPMDEAKYHPACFKCEACDEALAADEDVYEADSGFYHIACRQNVPHMLS